MCPCVLTKHFDFLKRLLGVESEVEDIINACTLNELECLVEIIYNSNQYFDTDLGAYFNRAEKVLNVSKVKARLIVHSIELQKIIASTIDLFLDQSFELVCAWDEDA
jgi:hypothetical protein